MVAVGPSLVLQHGMMIAVIASTLALVLVIIGAVVRRLRFVQSLASVPGPPALPILGNALILMGGQDGEF
jgi:hypothetical protein